MILLDTDHLTVLRFRAGERCVRLVARMDAARDEIFGTTIINVAEQVKGWLAAINKERDAVRQVTGYRLPGTRQVNRLLLRIPRRAVRPSCGSLFQ
jgi:tRNA(fMet)-specific endonuclease VapC